MMASLLEEKEKNERLALLLKDVAPRAVRTYFDREFPPTHLPSTLIANYDTLDNLKLRRILNQVQWNILFPTNEVPASINFDITLMICLIRNLKPIAQPIYGFDKLPLPVEKSPAADLARIKWYRNIVAHHNSKQMGTTDFNTAWSDLSDAVCRLGGKQMEVKCQEIKEKILDQSNQSNKRENIRLKRENDELRLVMEDPIPWNIRVQFDEELKTWTEDDKIFVETNGSKSVLKCIKENGCVVVTGSSGIGKSLLVRHTALQMQEGGYYIVPVKNPAEIIEWNNPGKKILFVVDDFCGTYTINPMKLESWKNLREEIKTLIEKKPVKLIMSCRLQVYRDEKMKSLSFFQSCECNLLSEGISLSKTEKQSIAEIHLKTNAPKIKEFYDMFDCFPLLCKLYSKNTKLRIEDFFKSPFTVYKEEIEILQTEGAHFKYCALALCVMLNNHIKEEWLTEDIDKDITKIIENTCEACKVAKGTSRLVLRDELDSLTHTFIRKDGEVYRTIHDKLFDVLAFYFGSVMIYCLINNASSLFIRERFVFEEKTKRDELFITVTKRYQKMYMNRMVDDWLRGKIVDVFNNTNMDNIIFRQRFLEHVQCLDISQQKQLASSIDPTTKSTPLIGCCYIGDIDLVTWCLYHCRSNVNHCRVERTSPLFFACQEGHTKVVQMLINNKADINKCSKTGDSPLLIACNGGHTEIIKILIHNKAKINKCANTGASPLYNACYHGRTEIVQMLLHKKANIKKSNNEGISPLHIACWNGHTEVVQMLINNKADIHECIDGFSPLSMACEKGHTKVAQMLINNNANIHKYADKEKSPLYIACREGHAEVVQMLINNNADINSGDDGCLPLHAACESGYTEVVQMLINNNANIHKCDDEEISPLYIACQEGHTEVVQMLTNNNADIDKCRDNGASPLSMACEEGHTDVVQMLINNNANIHKCNDEEISPLFMACEKGHTDVVQMLINNKANIYKCDNKEYTPLHVACLGGHTEVVQILINNKANVNKCNDTGQSPLFSACVNGNTEVVQILLNNKANIDKCDNENCSSLSVACQKGYIEVVQMLIHNKSNINKCDNEGYSPLFVACQEGHTDVVQMLINNKAEINKCNLKKYSPLIIACQEGHTDVVQMLINNKAEINKSNLEIYSPLIIACQEGHTDVVQMLINNKAEINKCNLEEISPLYIACQKGRTEVVQMLINNKAEINKCNLQEKSPLFIACQKGHTEVVKLLINNKADINKCMRTGQSPVFIASDKGHKEIVELLLQHDADINVRYNGRTPLDIARRNNHTNIKHLLKIQTCYNIMNICRCRANCTIT